VARARRHLPRAGRDRGGRGPLDADARPTLWTRPADPAGHRSSPNSAPGQQRPPPKGMLGRPGAGVLPDERPADGAEHPRDGRRRRPARPAQLEQSRAHPATRRAVDVDPIAIPHWAEPTHAIQIFRYAEQGSIKLLWVSATNPVVSLPDLPRIRRILAQEDLFVIVQDLFLTETTRLADVVRHQLDDDRPSRPGCPRCRPARRRPRLRARHHHPARLAPHPNESRRTAGVVGGVVTVRGQFPVTAYRTWRSGYPS
jgi:hypothetical protein